MAKRKKKKVEPTCMRCGLPGVVSPLDTSREPVMHGKPSQCIAELMKALSEARGER